MRIAGHIDQPLSRYARPAFTTLAQEPRQSWVLPRLSRPLHERTASTAAARLYLVSRSDLSPLMEGRFGWPKLELLSSWASDMFAVESCPALREIPGMGHTLRLADILAALRQLDGEDDDPPRPGGVPLRLRRPWAAAQRQSA